MNIPLALIERGQRLREVSEAQVEALAASIADVGLLNPITVYRCKVFRDGGWTEGFGLVAGAHRLAAFERLGRPEIAVTVVDLDDLERQIAECDENLQGPKLSPSERARFVKRRKDAYEALHPDAKAGAIRARAANAAMGHDVDANLARTFVADTAKATGASGRVVQRDAERGAKIIPEVLDMIKGTGLDTGSYMDQIKRLPGGDQFRAVERDLRNERRQQREAKAKAALSTKEGKHKAALKREVERLQDLWQRTSSEGRDAFMKKAGSEKHA